MIKWISGNESFRKEPKELRTKENSVLEDTKEFFRQCAKPFTHSWNSILDTLRQLRDYWKEFKEWHNDPVEVSTRVLVQYTPSLGGSIEVKVHSVPSSEDGSSLYKHAVPHQVPLSAFATLPAISSYRPKPTPYSRSRHSMIPPSNHASPRSSETKIASHKTKSHPEDAHMCSRPLRPFPRSAYSFTELPPGQDQLDPLIARRHHTEPSMPPQAAWAPTILQPQRRQEARKELPRQKSEMSSRPSMPSHADSWFEKS